MAIDLDEKSGSYKVIYTPSVVYAPSGVCSAVTWSYALQDLARQGNWIKMVDIARVAFIYMLGGMYLDTDMDIGPRTFSNQGVSVCVFRLACWPA